MSVGAVQVRAEKRTLLERRPRFGPRHNRANALKLPLPLPFTVSELMANFGEGALRADPAHRKGAPKKAPWEADRSVHAPLLAAEDDGDFDLLILGRPAVQRKNVLPLTDSKGNVLLPPIPETSRGGLCESIGLQSLAMGGY